MGESLGGWVVGDYAVRQVQTSSWGGTLPPISRLVIVDGVLQVHPEQGGGAQDSINNPQVGKLAHDFYVTQPQVDNSRVNRAIGPHMFAQPVSDQQLNTLHTPTLVIWGRDDKLQSIENGRHIAAADISLLLNSPAHSSIRLAPSLALRATVLSRRNRGERHGVAPVYCQNYCHMRGGEGI